MWKMNMCLILGLLLNACVTEVDMDIQLPEQIALNGVVMEDTFSKFTLQRFSNSSAPTFIDGAKIWITDKTGNKVECKGNWISKDYTSEQHKLFGASIYFVHCKIEGNQEMVAEVQMPQHSLEIKDYKLYEHYDGYAGAC